VAVAGDVAVAVGAGVAVEVGEGAGLEVGDGVAGGGVGLGVAAVAVGDGVGEGAAVPVAVATWEGSEVGVGAVGSTDGSLSTRKSTIAPTPSATARAAGKSVRVVGQRRIRPL